MNWTTGNYGATNTLLGSPSAIALANGVLWVADSNRLGAIPDNNRVLRFSDTGTYPGPTQDPTIIGSTCGICRGVADLVLGQPDFVSSNATLTPTGMRNPTGVATDGNVLAVADTDNNRILIWLSPPTTNGQAPDVVIGQADFTHNATSVPPTAKSLRGPTGLWMAGGKLYVADTQDNRILIYNKIPTTNNVAADVVVGQPDFTSFVQPDLTQESATPAANNMQDPVSVTTDATRMYVADLGQSRVLIFNTIPTTNGASADVVVGQPDMNSAADNNSFLVPASPTADADGNYMGVTPVLCQSNGTDSDGAALFPTRCAATLSFPRYALSDGKRLFIADGGNDRVLVYNSIPTTNGVRADVILGEPDEFTDNTGQNPSGSDAFQTPNTLVWDGVNNLYVSDTYNNRVVVYSPGVPNIPLAAARNSASLEIYALGSVVIGGTINAKDVVTIGINNTACTSGQTTDGCYSYTIVAADTYATIATALTKAINSGPDPNVTAGADTTTGTVVLTARVPDQAGANITLTTVLSVNAQITATASGANLSIYLQSPTSIAPGTQISIYSAPNASLCDTSAVGSTAQPYLPFTLNGCEIFIDGTRAPLMYVSPTQINAQMPVEYSDRTSVSLYSRITHADGSITVGTPIGVTIVPENPGVFAQYGSDPRPGIVFHGSSNAVDGIAFDGAVTAADVDTIGINNSACTSGQTTGGCYSYTVLSTDTLPSVAQAFVNLINATPDPYVTASLTNEFTTILLTARVPGPSGEGITVDQQVSTNATEILTVYNGNLCCSNTQGAMVTSDNPAVPGELLYVYATGLGPTNPNDQSSGQVFQAPGFNPPATPVDSILAGGTSANIYSAALLPGTVGVYYVLFQLSTGQVTDPATQLTIAQQAHVSNVVTFPVVIPPTITTTSGSPAGAAARPARDMARPAANSASAAKGRSN